MKVVCVDDKPRMKDAYILPCGFVVEGEIYTVLQVVDTPCGPHYIISEKPVIPKFPNSIPYWNVNRFVPLTYYESEFQVSEAEERTAQHEINATSGGEVCIAQKSE